MRKDGCDVGTDRSAAQTDCPACDGPRCTHGEGCLIEEAFGPTESQKRRDAERSAASTLTWPPRHRRELIEHARLAYEAHWEQMLMVEPHLRMTPWDDQDAAVREAWIEHITPEERRFP